MTESSTTQSVSRVVIGTSPIPTIIGYITAFFDAVDLYFKTGGQMPSNRGEWLQAGSVLAIGIVGRFTKQSNVTNASVPTEARTVPEVLPIAKP